GMEYSIRFDDNPAVPTNLLYIPPGIGVPAEYEIEIEVLAGGPVAMSRNVNDNILPMTLDNVTIYLLDPFTGDSYTKSFKFGDAAAKAPPYTFYMPSARGQTVFTANTTGIIRQIEFPHVADPLGDVDNETLYVEVQSLTDSAISSGQISGNFLQSDDGLHAFGQPVSIVLDPPLQVTAGQNYNLSIVSDSPLTTLGSVVATEGPWDDPIPYKVCPLPEGTELTRSDTASGYTHPTCTGLEMYGSHYYGLELFLAAEDEESKRENMINILDKTDYLTISSNRFYDTLSRIPFRWPLTLDYYDALFSGELGFDLVLQWDSYPRVGPFVWKDQVLPTDDLPEWLNEFEAEEAFTVYDHPTVFIFKKSQNYDPARTRELLSTNVRQYKEAFGGLLSDEIPVNRLVLIAPQAGVAPTALMLPDDLEIEQEKTAWSDILNVDALINRNHTAAVVAWWLLMLVIGW
ncbi:MAG TPA: hypothetical protein VJZ27_05930, partial [Aggregatilineales bacterium]|nr:hypothetical protein [Aggregatilineales bacterium]